MFESMFYCTFTAFNKSYIWGCTALNHNVMSCDQRESAMGNAE